MTRKKQFIINLIAQVTSFAVTMGISFFLSPFIVKTVGSEAYGFVTLGNNFISYASLIAAAINSMSSRFVTIELTNKNFDKANRYFSSVFFANSALTVIFFIPAVFIVIFLDRIVNVSSSIVGDVRLLWSIIFAQFLISLMFNVFCVATFATNKLYLSSIRTIVGQVIRTVILLVSYNFFPSHIWYIGLASIVMTIYTGFTNYTFTKKLTPDLKIRKAYFEFGSIKEIISSGIWNSISSLGTILSESLDLLITNLFVGKELMGILSVSKTIPSAVSSLIGTIVGIFVPSLTIDFAKKNYDSIKKQILFSMKITGLITCLPISALIVIGNEFYSLWQPTLDSKQLQVLSILTVSSFMISGTINVIYNIFTVTNKVKFSALVQVAFGLFNTLTVLILVKYTNLGVYAVAGVSSVTAIIKNLTIIVPYACKCLHFKKSTFYPQIFKCLLAMILSMVLGIVAKSPFTLDNWFSLAAFVVAEVICSTFVYLAICTNKEDRAMIVDMIKNMVSGKLKSVKNK